MTFRFVFIVHAAGLLVLAHVGCGGPAAKTNAPPEQPRPTQPNAVRFDVVTNRTGVDFSYQEDEAANHSTLLETVGGGVAMFDYDLDGHFDLCFPGGGKFDGKKACGAPTALFRNLGDWKFEATATVAGVDRATHYSHGISAGDYDSDGFGDLIITGYGGVLLYRNQGDGSFGEVAVEAGIVDDSWSTSAAWGDLDGDGHLDLYITHYLNWSFDNHPWCKGETSDQREICSPVDFAPLPDVVYLNNGDGTFRDATAELKLSPGGKGLGVIIGDLDNDNDQDIYVANDMDANFLYLGKSDGGLDESGVLGGAALDDNGKPNGSMGVDVCDYNQDGLADILVANFERESFALYRNEGHGQFSHVSRSTGFQALGGLYVGWGTACADFDHDGDEDVVVATGNIKKRPASGPREQIPLFLENKERRFRKITFSNDEYFGRLHEGRGLATGDADNDGDLDIVISHLREPVALLENNSEKLGGWLGVRLVGVESNRDAYGARLVLATTQGEFTRHLMGGGSYLSQRDARVLWGLPDGAAIQNLTIHWPSGALQRVTDVKPNSFVTVIEQ